MTHGLAPELSRRDGSKAAVLARLQRGAATNVELNDLCYRTVAGTVTRTSPDGARHVYFHAQRAVTA
jgi:hypothetical protein